MRSCLFPPIFMISCTILGGVTAWINEGNIVDILFWSFVSWYISLPLMLLLIYLMAVCYYILFEPREYFNDHTYNLKTTTLIKSAYPTFQGIYRLETSSMIYSTHSASALILNNSRDNSDSFLKPLTNFRPLEADQIELLKQLLLTKASYILDYIINYDLGSLLQIRMESDFGFLDLALFIGESDDDGAYCKIDSPFSHKHPRKHIGPVRNELLQIVKKVFPEYASSKTDRLFSENGIDKLYERVNLKNGDS